MNKKRVFLDIDGVLANFTKSMANLIGVPFRSHIEIPDYWAENQRRDLTYDEIREQVYKDPDFFANLEPFPWAHRIVDFLQDNKVDWRFLTSSMPNHHCPSGKYRWTVKHFGKDIAEKLTIVWDSKSFYCRPDDLLIDDMDKNNLGWEKAGGLAFWWRHIGPDHPEANDQVDQLFRFLTKELDLKKHV